MASESKEKPLEVLQKFSKVCGKINKMSKEEIIEKLKSHNLCIHGNKEVLKKRLKMYYKRKKLMSNKRKIKFPNVSFDYFIIIDFEATCIEDNNAEFIHEIIEFPALLFSVKQLKIIDEFHEYCCPQINPKLSSFCKSLTGIQQETIDSAEPFDKVFRKFSDWLSSHQLLNQENNFAILTDSPTDMCRFLYNQCEISDVLYPEFANQWINVKKSFANFYQLNKCKLSLMLQCLGLEFEGRLHCGLDDAKNIARLVTCLLREGAVLHPNERLFIKGKEISYEPIVYNFKKNSTLEKEKLSEEFKKMNIIDKTLSVDV